ncbi:hypothetical protein LCGC14_1250120 [marine sediment metagenome]|uniref:Uncharacterized protein n=1 Tax=marine sediment metagenome TaxID=412755 RepID=A0A0F9L3B5_9ZZZZ
MLDLRPIIHKMMVFCQETGVGLPVLGIFNIDDGSILIEFSFSNLLRVGFNIETDQQNSGWYVVSNEILGGITACGYI